jgi:hypothetical protein
MSLSELDGSADSNGLTEPQRRHVSVFLQQVEEALDEIERVAYEAPSDAKLFRTDIADLPDGFGAAFEPEASRIRAQLKDLAEGTAVPLHLPERRTQLEGRRPSVGQGSQDSRFACRRPGDRIEHECAPRR